NPAVVNITQYGREGGNVVPVSQGSGFVYDAEGHVVTNAHVVHGSDQIDVTFADGIVRAAELIGEDLNSDLAVVKINALPEGVSPLALGDMASLSVGQTVIAIGNPFGLAGTLTRGVISALGRTIPALTPFSIPQAIQTDAAINPGNSGGPLLNLQGEVIGVNAQIETGGSSRANSGVGFAIPVSIVKLVVPDLIEQGVHEWAWLGVSGGDLAPVMAQAMQVPFEKGAYLSAVIANGPADKAGLRGSSGVESVEGRQVEVGGDVITAIDGNEMRSFDDMLIYIALYAAPGQEVELSVWRDGEFRQVKVTLEARPESMPEG
ncbi:MAG: trypsin-like peptidase domain-containing protein, partial [Anaerolineales bacterium]|nr:trypsin-like peptidase domain-containing protein [Anaerolineales bacterium]